DRREGGPRGGSARRDGGYRGKPPRSEGGSHNRHQSAPPRELKRGDDTRRNFPGLEEGERPAHNPADLRVSNRADRPRSPEIDSDVTGKELDRITRAELRYLDEKNFDWVAKHLVMAGRLIDFEPEIAYEHAMAASRRGGRVAVVREAVGLTAYTAGNYAEALREFRTFRRISGSNIHLPVMADCERGLGKPEKALETAHSEEATTLDTPGRVEMAIVAAGAQSDLGNRDAAVSELQIPQLDINRAFSFSPRLFEAYAMALEAVGKQGEAELWRRQISLAERALGVGEFQDPDIMDLGDDEDSIEDDKPRARDFINHAGTSPEAAGDTSDKAAEASSSVGSDSTESDTASSAPEPEQ
ncbi:MAG: hypothetical protein L0J11_02195, partial [Micrococcaceae bacterium]|nr:hypothetical protein [Micrococcaceae bacterium]